jgi:hypothetical protein
MEDSSPVTRAEIDKTFVIQNLFQRALKPALLQEIFFNLSLDTNLSPTRQVAPVDSLDNHPQAIGKKGQFLSCHTPAKSPEKPGSNKENCICRQSNRSEKSRRKTRLEAIGQAIVRQTKNPARRAGFLEWGNVGTAQAESDFTRCARRETFREAVLECITPLLAARISSGCAALKAASAAVLSPEASASST